MITEMEIAGIQIPQSDWKATPESVKAVVTVLSERLGYIEEQLKQNSQNSFGPPSSDSLANSDKSNSRFQGRVRSGGNLTDWLDTKNHSWRKQYVQFGSY